MRAGPIFDELFLLDWFFFTVFVERRDCWSREDFFVRFVVAIFDVVRLLLVFFFSGIAAVYHRASEMADRVVAAVLRVSLGRRIEAAESGGIYLADVLTDHRVRRRCCLGFFLYPVCGLDYPFATKRCGSRAAIRCDLP
ncbi:MAG TPA: hypothetical protein VEK33_25640 [Terriglobales bacterium]|nr:hypothetical protein [Terriglobales bacterium]